MPLRGNSPSGPRGGPKEKKGKQTGGPDGPPVCGYGGRANRPVPDRGPAVRAPSVGGRRAALPHSGAQRAAHRKKQRRFSLPLAWRSSEDGQAAAGGTESIPDRPLIRRCAPASPRGEAFIWEKAPAAVAQPGPYLARETVSRVLYLTVIYLDAPLPVRSSHLLRTAGPAICPFHGVAPDSVSSDGHSRAVGGALTAPFHPDQGG